jgi:hypothetical protein
MNGEGERKEIWGGKKKREEREKEKIREKKNKNNKNKYMVLTWLN